MNASIKKPIITDLYACSPNIQDSLCAEHFNAFHDDYLAYGMTSVDDAKKSLLHDYPKESKENRLFVLTLDNNVIGSVCINLNHSCKISSLLVSKKYRGRGYGSHLLRFAERFLLSRNISTGQLEAYDDTVKFYTKREWDLANTYFDDDVGKNVNVLIKMLELSHPSEFIIRNKF